MGTQDSLSRRRKGTGYMSFNIHRVILPVRKRRIIAFTLVELIVVLAIIALLSTLVLPLGQTMILKARSLKCSYNLKSIGLAAAQAASDNNNQYPEIDQAAVPIYPSGSGATNLIGALGPYGITTNTIQCPIDMGSHPSSFQTYGSSYEWNPVFDDESTTTPTLYFGTQPIPVNSTHVRLCADFLPIHKGRVNAVYGDGHVTVH